MLFHFSTSASSSAFRFSRVLTWSNLRWRESRAARVLRARFKATLSLGSTMIGGRGPFRRRGLVTDALAAGEPVTDDFLRWDAFKTTGELELDSLDLPVEVALTVRSSAGAAMLGAASLGSSSGNRGNQLSETKSESGWNMGDVSKLPSCRKGESLTSGEVMLVNVVEGGADWWGSAKMSLGETVRMEPGAEGLMAVKAEAGASQDMSAPRPAYKLAPESNELLLFKSAMEATWGWEMGVLELENNGTGGRCCN